LTTEPADPTPRRWIFWALGCWLAALVLTFAGFLATYHSGPWRASAEPYVINGAQLAVRGQGRVEGTRVLIEGPAPDGTAAAILNFFSPIEARSFRVVSVQVSGAYPPGGVSLVWRVKGSEERAVNRVELVNSGGRILPVTLGSVDGWSGSVLGIGLIARGDFRAPFVIERIELKPASAWTTIDAMVSAWLEFEPWDGGSIHFMAGGNPALKHPLPLFLGISFVVAIGLYLLVIVLGHTRFDPKVALAIALLGWALIDVRWQWNLAKQLDITRFQYAGKSWEDKRLAAEDGALFAFMREAAAKIGDKPAHIFVFSDDEYGRVRGAYHLYPKNVSVHPKRQTLLPAATYKAGDVLVLFRKRGVEYNQADKRLRWEGTQSVTADLIHFSQGSAVFRVTGS